MTDTVTTTPAPAAPAGVSDDLAYLAAHGEDISELSADLESLLGGPKDAPAPISRPAPTSTEPDYRLGIDMDGKEIPLAPVERAAPVSQQDAQAKALDPYAVDAPRAPDASNEAEPEPGELYVDPEGRTRDAKTGRYVPHAAMEKERIRRKELQAENQKYREDNARVQERLNVLTEIIQGQKSLVEQQQTKAAEPAAPAAPAEIDPEVDVFAAVRQLQTLQKAQADAAQEKIRALEQTANQRFDAIQSTERYRQDALNFSLQNPDFPQAYTYFNERRRDELKLLGLTDERGINEQIMTEERIIMQRALQSGEGPASMIYKLAQNRGYTKAAPTPAPQAPAPHQAPAAAPVASSTQAQPSPAPAQPTISQDSADHIRRVQNGQQASATLTGAGGKGGEGLTVQQLADMPEAEFLQFAAKIGPKKLDRLLGWTG